ELPFSGHVMFGGRWFSKYPPAWPAVLAIADRFRAGWFACLLLSSCLLLLTGSIARIVFTEDTARLSVLLMCASPYFLFNSMGYLSHPLCAVFAAAAMLFFEKARRSQAPRFWPMFACIGAALLVRPYTAFCIGLVLALAALWRVRSSRRAVGKLVLEGLVAALCTVAALAAYNHALTGSYWRSTYALARGTNVPVELSLSVSTIVHNLLYTGRWSVESTAVYCFPFLFALAAFCIVKESRKYLSVIVLGMLFVILVGGYLLQPEWSTCRYGERYYFEGLFGVAILAARGVELLWGSATGFSAKAVAIILVALLLAEAAFFAVATRKIFGFTRYTAGVQRAFDQLEMPDAVSFYADSRELNYIDRAKNINPNAADWRDAAVIFLPDPGPTYRDAVTRALKRTRWVLLGSDSEVSPVRILSYKTLN
ncbi:MAG: hypothetical protein ABIZ80_25760, partial [Bryobacteraceae bacterium]